MALCNHYSTNVCMRGEFDKIMVALWFFFWITGTVILLKFWSEAFAKITVTRRVIMPIWQWIQTCILCSLPLLTAMGESKVLFFCLLFVWVVLVGFLIV